MYTSWASNVKHILPQHDQSATTWTSKNLAVIMAARTLQWCLSYSLCFLCFGLGWRKAQTEVCHKACGISSWVELRVGQFLLEQDCWLWDARTTHNSRRNTWPRATPHDTKPSPCWKCVPLKNITRFSQHARVNIHTPTIMQSIWEHSFTVGGGLGVLCSTIQKKLGWSCTTPGCSSKTPVLDLTSCLHTDEGQR